jgi:predicted sulfurtransferase
MITIYYRYITIDNPALIANWQRALCTKLQLTGRIILAHEGINGTVGGTDAAVVEYKKAMQEHPLFANLDYKDSPGDATAFPKLKISIKNEIVRLGVDPNKITAAMAGEHLSPEQAHQKIAEKLAGASEDIVILDARNNYETAIGAFIDSINPNINTFRELPEFIDKNPELFKDKEVVMCCTAGIRCERASAYLKSKNIAKKVYQITGGIHRYLEQFPKGYFKGKNFVFDERIVYGDTGDVISKCALCKQSCDGYTHCVNVHCNNLVLLCDPCKEQSHNTCSSVCKELVATKQVRVRTKHLGSTQCSL